VIVDPYKRPPAPPVVCILNREGAIVSEHGQIVDPDDWPADHRAWVDYDTVRELVNDGKGEALCWNGEEIRWRHRRLEDGWRTRRSDVAVLRLPFPEDERSTLRALGGWRDWLARYGASPTGTSGSAAWSLLRATLGETLFCSMGATPPLLQTLGGRVQLGPAGPGRFEGELRQVDLEAAYARSLAGLRYGGRWFTSDDLPSHSLDPEWWAREGRPVFVRAVVAVPRGLEYGPLIRKPRKRMSQLALFFDQVHGDRYPVGCTLAGIWTWQELAAATERGARIMALRELWVHLAARRPFERWWDAVSEGRALGGLTGLLAKTTGNALWGRFCMDPRVQGRRSVRGRNGKLRSRELPLRGGIPPAHDLAETVSGRVRAELYRMMANVGSSLLSAHTDGAWLTASSEAVTEGGRERSATGPAGRRKPQNAEPPSAPLDPVWRVKQHARAIELLDPQTLRYWPRPPVESEPWVVYAGVPAGLAAESFERAWEKAALVS
jgi:hypothetical protein